MTLSPRAHERAELVALLESDAHDSAEKLADALLRQAFTIVQRRNLYTVLVGDAEGVGVYGPFATPVDASRAAKKAENEYKDVRLGRMWATDWLEPAAALVDAERCSACGHPRGAHQHLKGAGKCWALTAKKSARGCACDTFTG